MGHVWVHSKHRRERRATGGTPESEQTKTNNLPAFPQKNITARYYRGTTGHYRGSAGRVDHRSFSRPLTPQPTPTPLLLRSPKEHHRTALPWYCRTLPRYYVTSCTDTVVLPRYYAPSCYDTVVLPRHYVPSCYDTVVLPRYYVPSCYDTVALPRYYAPSHYRGTTPSPPTLRSPNEHHRTGLPRCFRTLPRYQRALPWYYHGATYRGTTGHYSPSKSQVAQLNRSVQTHENIGRLKVPVHDPLAVHMQQGIADLGEVAPHRQLA